MMGGSAFPQSMVDFGKGPEEPGPYGMGGMSLRDYFAGQALAAIVSKIPVQTVSIDEFEQEERCAIGAYAYADAMIAERER